MDSDWGVAVAEPQRYRVAQESLSASSFETFTPIIEHLSIVRGRHVRHKTPMFGRYILVVINDTWKAILALRGISGMLLTADNKPALVDAKEIEAVRAICVNGVYRNPEIQTDGMLRYGQRVRTKADGPFAWQVGTYDGRVGRKKEAAIFYLFGRDQRVVFKRGQLIAA